MEEYTQDEEFVYKLKAEGVGYALLNYFGNSDIRAIEDVELRKAAKQAKVALGHLDKILSKKFSHIEA